MEVKRRSTEQWTPEMLAFERHPGTYWAERRRLSATIQESFARAEPEPSKFTQCVEPLAQLPGSLAEYTWSGHH